MKNKIILFCATICLWYLTAYTVGTPYLVPYPHKVIAELIHRPSIYITAEIYTAVEAIIGLALSIVIALALSITIFFVPAAEAYIMPYAIGIKATPVIAVAPLLAVWCGPGIIAKVIMSSLISFFPILQNVTDAFKSAPVEVRAYMRTLGATRYQDLRNVRMWLALPAFASGLKVAAPLAVVGAMVSEFLGADNGVGHLLFMFVSKAQTIEIFASILSVVIIGWSLYGLMFLFERAALAFLRVQQEEYTWDGVFV